MLGTGVGLIVLGFVLFGVAVVTQVLRLRNTVGVVGSWASDDPKRGLDQLKTAADKAKASWSPVGLAVTALSGVLGVGSGVVGIVLVVASLVRG